MLAALRCAAFVLPLALATTLRAQVGGSVVATSDERSRGVSLSGERPSLRLSLSYDHAGGAYLGASLSTMEFEPGQRRAALLVYAGFSGALDDQRRWDAGLTRSHFAGDAGYDYTEGYLGLGGERWNTRLYFAPDYFGRGLGTLYAELDFGWPLGADWRLAAHAGGLHRSDGRGETRFDARLGLGLRAGGVDWQLAATAVTSDGPYRLWSYQHRKRLLVSAAIAF